MRSDAVRPVEADSPRAAALSGIRLLRETPIAPGDRWIFSAGFNVGRRLDGTSRIDAELADLEHLANHSARICILSHQGSWSNGSAHELDHVADYLAQQLSRPVHYVPHNSNDRAVFEALRLAPGDLALFGNTRLNEGEEQNDSSLAEQFARLGDRVAVGGFSKAHRAHASNAGILDWIPGFAANSLVMEIDRLQPWRSDAMHTVSVAAIGGVKYEKMEALEHFLAHYDYVIPGGAVLNALLRAAGVDTASSELGEHGERSHAIARRVLGGSNRLRLHLPRHVLVAPKGASNLPAKRVSVEDGVPAGNAIVDFEIEPSAIRIFARLTRSGGRALLAGTPTLVSHGYTSATDIILSAFNSPQVVAILLGGDTLAELPWTGPLSSGGGSALKFLATGDCEVLRALRQKSPTPFKSRSGVQP